MTVGAEVDSYRQLPLTVYQIQVKFRDEARPRFGLLRTRELIMADAYSFDVDKEAMQVSYRKVFDAYLRIFGRLELEVVPVEAASGAIGGDVNHEFMVPSAVGEDHFVSCPSCGYAANVEAAIRAGSRRRPEGHRPSAATPWPSRWPSTTPRTGRGSPTWSSSSPTRGRSRPTFSRAWRCSTIRGGPPCSLVPGDREARLPGGWRLFEERRLRGHPSLVKGYIGPIGQQHHGVRVVADLGVARPGPWIVGGQPEGPPPDRSAARAGLHRRRVGLVRRGGGRRRLPALRRGPRVGPFGGGGPHLPAGSQVLRGHAGFELRGRGRGRGHRSRWAATGWGSAGCWRWWPRSTTMTVAWPGRPKPLRSRCTCWRWAGDVPRGGRGGRPALPAVGRRRGRGPLRRPGRVAGGQVHRRRSDGHPGAAGGRGQGSGPRDRGVAVPGHRRGTGAGRRRSGGGPGRRA